MTTEEFQKLSREEMAAYQSHRTCEECGNHLVRTGHSLGDLHAVCIYCHYCPDCEEGE